MKLGFTGSRHGITQLQLAQVKLFLMNNSPEQLHHGDCAGADYEAHKAARAAKIYIVVHPPTVHAWRMYLTGDESRDPKPYLERNKDIVDETDCLLACPRSPREKHRSGTFATVHYARTQGKPVTIIFPNGEVKRG